LHRLIKLLEENVRVVCRALLVPHYMGSETETVVRIASSAKQTLTVVVANRSTASRVENARLLHVGECVVGSFLTRSPAKWVSFVVFIPVFQMVQCPRKAYPPQC
jgi:hypothetical protein